ncbi:MAG: indole-3-glycerol phosphate synthase TrpC, partial [Trichococcus flocculiformis]
TEPDFFQGENRFLTEIKQAVSLPVIRKDFIIDAYQIYEAKVIGADAVLLIATILNEEELDALQRLARELGLSALVEAHTEEELLKALRTNPKMIGVNNRDLKTFKVDIQQSIRLRALVPDDILFVAESGISERQQVIELEAGNVDAILIGETMMISPDKKGMLDRLRGIG